MPWWMGGIWMDGWGNVKTHRWAVGGNGGTSRSRNTSRGRESVEERVGSRIRCWLWASEQGQGLGQGVKKKVYRGERTAKERTPGSSKLMGSREGNSEARKGWWKALGIVQALSPLLPPISSPPPSFVPCMPSPPPCNSPSLSPLPPPHQLQTNSPQKMTARFAAPGVTHTVHGMSLATKGEFPVCLWHTHTYTPHHHTTTAHAILCDGFVSAQNPAECNPVADSGLRVRGVRCSGCSGCSGSWWWQPLPLHGEQVGGPRSASRQHNQSTGRYSPLSHGRTGLPNGSSPDISNSQTPPVACYPSSKHKH